MIKVVKFGGSSLADAVQIKKAGKIVLSEEARRYVVPSAPGKRFSDDTKVTDMLYRCYGAAVKEKKFTEIIYVFLTIFLYLPKCPQSLILSVLRAFCFCGKPRISRSIFLYFPCQSWLKSW